MGTVVPTRQAIIPAAVGVDIGCGMIASKTSLTSKHLPDSLRAIRARVERAVPHGRSSNRHISQGADKGSWGRDSVPASVAGRWRLELETGFRRIVVAAPKLEHTNHVVHLGTLGTGNHFVEICLDESDAVWVMLHSGSRGVGNAIGSAYIELAKQDMRKHLSNLPDKDLAYLQEGTTHFDDYWFAVGL